MAQYRDVRCKVSPEIIREALVGNYQREHVFALNQALALYDFYQVQVAECDQEIESALARLRADIPAPQAPLPPARSKNGHSANGLQFDVREALYALLGVDLTQIHGLGPYISVKLISECGTDMAKWPSAKHFARPNQFLGYLSPHDLP